MSKEKIKQKLIVLFIKYGIKQAALFGSYACNMQQKNSDIDLLVDFDDENKSLLDLIGLEQEIEEVLHIKADVVTEKSISPLLKEKILKEKEIIYG
ncbi:MAG: nucleotidyltransferase family protein [Spirochaetales bacterium]|nr:nucleotidyltransferase family protein [Spirochaetales bacterium]